MSATQFTKSAHHQFIESPHHQRGKLGDPGEIERKDLYVGKIWPGMHSWDDSTTANRRRRWFTRTVDWSIDVHIPDPPTEYTESYTSVDAYEGDGFCPTTTMPDEISGSMAAGLTVVPGGVIFFQVGIEQAPDSLLGEISSSLTARGYFGEDIFDTYEQYADEVLSDESDYQTPLATCHAAVAGLSFSSIDWEDFAGFRFDEYGEGLGISNANGPNKDISSFDPGDFTGDLVDDTTPNFGDTAAGDAHEQLDLTFWGDLMPDLVSTHPVMTSLWHVEAYSTVNAEPESDIIYARRGMFRSTKPATYFIAEGDFTENGQLANPVLIETGIVSSAGREIPLPALGDVSAGNKGRVAFAIVGESTGAWQTRTGITLA